MKLASCVLYVFDLDESASFYRDLLGLEVSLRTTTAALMVDGSSGCQLYLRALGSNAPHTLGGIGLQCMIWTAADAEELRRCEEVLRKRDAHVTTGHAEGFDWVEGRDPSDVPVMVSHPGPDEVPRQEIITRIYAW
ncbi:VOC family protein [Streptomyces sp. NBC_01317]|uniref:VOC family protein n=1 Tax=Streptomyces sp. NBC_01317 TaxID=2903822 RepID=UPI002E1399FC|nr:VOC family protein [Streptomyces sp. NBC_01317]